jgi:uncharacterized protein DUF6962
VTQSAVALSDYALTVESGFLAVLARRHRRVSQLRPWVVLFFATSAIASFAGGSVHGFAADPASRGHRILWPASLVSVGIVGFAGSMIGAILAFRPRTVTRIGIAAGTGLGIYCTLALRGKQRYAVAVAALLPPTAFLGAVLWQTYRRVRRPSLLAGLVGIGVSLLAAGVQQARVSIHPRFIDHNVIYHLLQGASLILLYRCFDDLLVSRQAYQEGSYNRVSRGNS